MHQHVLFPSSKKGLNPKEHTIADHLKDQGYATACFGKWHLGHHPETLPQSNGFDTYLGIPYSNDMNHPDNKGKPKGGWAGMDALWGDPESTLTKWKTPLMENEKILEVLVDQRTVTRRYTDKSIEFIKRNKDKPFFLYLPHSMPHIPLYVPDEIRDPNPLNAYTNVIEHIDSEVGRIANLLRELKLAQNTYLIFTTDNGPWLQFKHHGGSAGPLREGKGTTFEGGQRVPCVMWGPGRIPAGTTCDELCGTIDLLPTIASLTEAPLPKENKIDGLDISNLLTGGTKSPRNEFIYYTSRGDLEGLRQGKYKVLIKKNRRRKNQPANNGQVMLFDLDSDLGEKTNLADKHPEIVAKLGSRMKELDAEITKNQRQPWLKK
jgi:arylsulfatase A-like enzyme